MKILHAAHVTQFHMKDFTSPSEGHMVELAAAVWLTSESEVSSRHQGWGKVTGSAAI